MIRVIGLLITEMIIWVVYFWGDNRYYNKDLNIFFMLQALVFVVALCYMLIKLKKLTVKNFCIIWIISLIIGYVTVINNDAVIAYINDDLEYNDGIYYLEPLRQYDTFNQFDRGYNIRVVDEEKYDTDNNEISNEILDLGNLNFAINGRFLNYPEMISFNNDKELVNQGDKTSSFNDGENIYSVNYETEKIYFSVLQQNGGVVKNLEINNSCYIDELDNGTSAEYWYLSYVDEKEAYIMFSDDSEEINIIKVNQDGDCSKFSQLTFDQENIIFPTFIKFDKIDDEYLLNVISAASEVYSISLDSDGNVKSEKEYLLSNSLYNAFVLNVYYDGEKTYVISHVSAKGNLWQDYTGGHCTIVRIDEIDDSYNLISSAYLKHDNLGNYGKYFKVDKQGDEYILYSNNSILKYKTYEKNKFFIFNKILIRYVGYLLLLIVIALISKKVKSADIKKKTLI